MANITDGIILNKGFGKGVRIQLQEYKGKKFLSIGEMWKENEDDEEWKYSKKNITINRKIIKQFLEVIDENCDDIEEEILLG